VFYFTGNQTTSKIISKLFQPLNYFNIISATLNMLENIHELQ